MEKQRGFGFTLIELLVVIAIIALLTSVVLASLNSARLKAADTAIRSDLNTIKNQAALYYDTHKDYGGKTGDPGGAQNDCVNLFDSQFIDSTALAAARHAKQLSGDAGSAICYVSDGATPTYLVSIPLKSDPLHTWCVDSEGNDGQYNTDEHFAAFYTLGDDSPQSCNSF